MSRLSHSPPMRELPASHSRTIDPGAPRAPAGHQNRTAEAVLFGGSPGLMPASAGLQDEGERAHAADRDDESENAVLHRVHPSHVQRMPAPSASATADSEPTTNMKRARTVFMPNLPCAGGPDGYSATGRSCEQDPWLCVPASRRGCPGRCTRRRRPSPLRAPYGAVATQPIGS